MKGIAAIQNLSATAKVSEDVTRGWLKKQTIWQIYLPAPRHTKLTSSFYRVIRSDARHIRLPLPWSTSPADSKRLSLWLQKRPKRWPKHCPARTLLKWAKLLQVDPWCELMGAINQLLAKHGISVRRGRVDIHRDQGIVERFNRTLAERLFGHQYAQEMQLPSGQRSTVGCLAARLRCSLK